MSIFYEPAFDFYAVFQKYIKEDSQQSIPTWLSKIPVIYPSRAVKYRRYKFDRFASSFLKTLHTRWKSPVLGELTTQKVLGLNTYPNEDKEASPLVYAGMTDLRPKRNAELTDQMEWLWIMWRMRL